MDITFDDMKLIGSVPISEPAKSENIRAYNVGDSDYSKHKIQPWDLWIDYQLNPFDADIVKRVLRHKKSQSRREDYEKIIHICKERIRQIDAGVKWKCEE